MAEALSQRFIYSRKPSPTLVSTDVFDEDAIRADIRKTLEAGKPHRCTIEFAMKDVHTLKNQPQRLNRWVELAYAEINRMLG